MNKTRKIIASAMVAGAATFLVGANAHATTDDPHKEQQDGCDHGNSGNGNIGEGNSGNGNIGNGNSGNGNIGDGNSGNGNIGNGDSGKECRDDPSDKGKDCDVHGIHGGINEDHCLLDAVTTTTVPEVTVPPVPEVTVPPVPEVTVPEVTVPGATDSIVPAPVEKLPATGTSSEALAGLGAGMLLLGAGLRKLVR